MNPGPHCSYSLKPSARPPPSCAGGWRARARHRARGHARPRNFPGEGGARQSCHPSSRASARRRPCSRKRWPKASRRSPRHAPISEVERTSNADLRQAVESADQQLASARSNETQALANHEQVMASSISYARTQIGGRASAGRRRRRMGAASGNRRGRRQSPGRARSNADAAGPSSPMSAAGARSSETQTLADSRATRGRLEGLRAELDAAGHVSTRSRPSATRSPASCGHAQLDRRVARSRGRVRDASPAAAPAADTRRSIPAMPRKATASQSTKPTTEDGWQAVRLANRYAFGEEFVVQINGDPGKLFDLSITGCQLLSPTALKPNHTVKVSLPDEKKPSHLHRHRCLDPARAVRGRPGRSVIAPACASRRWTKRRSKRSPPSRRHGLEL